MGVTNEFERDVNDASFLKRPGRVDLIVLQNIADCGDGHPGLQRAFRNYLHEGGMEKDLDMVGYSIKGTSVDINNAEMQQLSNIGAVTISSAQWVFIGQADQDVRIADSPTFGGLSLTGNLVLAANSITGTSVNIDNAELQQLSNIGTKTISNAQWGYVGNMDQEIHKGHSPEFAGLTINGHITITGNVDGVDVSDLKDAFDTHKASTGADHTWLDQSVVSGTSPTFVGLTLSDALITSSTVDGVDISAFKTDYDDKISVPVSISLTEAGNVTGTASEMDEINDGNTGVTNYCIFDTDEYVILDFGQYVHITKFGYTPASTSQNDDGTFELYYDDGNGDWTKILSFTVDQGGILWQWKFLDGSVITKKIKLLCTLEDTDHNESRIAEIGFK